jgi:flavin reductase (DIM6/NTAB) family NADH-FMN oxidoreductase RutF
MVASDRFKQVLARWATGVTIVTSRDGEAVHGMTVSAFTEVSLTPPLVLVCADKKSHTNRMIAASGIFAVNILAGDQSALSNRFASKEQEAERFVGLDYTSGKTGAPLLPGTAASLDCRLVATHDHGDHFVYVGEVVDAHVRDAEPLLYHGGRYGCFVPV